MEDLKINDILELVFTTKNPETGSKPPEKAAWVIFENETICLIAPNNSETSETTTFEELIGFGKRKIRRIR